jgi:hypothetical protein
MTMAQQQMRSLVYVGATMALLATGCGKSSDKDLDPVEAVKGRYTQGGRGLVIGAMSMDCEGCDSLPFTKGIHPSGGVARFDDAVIDEDLIGDDECSGTIEPTDAGVVIVISGDEACAAYGGAWEFESGARLAAAEARLESLDFKVARNLLTDLHPRDAVGKEKYAAFLARKEVTLGLEWQSRDEASESYFSQLVQLVKIGGTSAPRARGRLLELVRNLCSDEDRRAQCLSALDAAAKVEWSSSEREALALHAAAVTSDTLKGAMRKETQGDTEVASEAYRTICEVFPEGEECTRAKARLGKIHLREGQREYAAGHYAAAKTALEAAVATKDAAVAREAERLLQSPTLIAGNTLESARTQLASSGPSDAIVTMLAPVCVQGPNTAPCMRARALSGEVQLQLAKSEMAGNRFTEAEKRLNALVAQGGQASFAARAILRDKQFLSQRTDEGERARADAAIARCNTDADDCETVANAALESIVDSTQSDRVTVSLTAFQRLRAEKALASCADGAKECETRASALLPTLLDETLKSRLQDGLMGYRATMSVSNCQKWAPDCEAVAEAALKTLGDTVHAGRVRKALSDYRSAVAGISKSLEAVEEVASQCRDLNDAQNYGASCFPEGFSEKYSGKPISVPLTDRVGAGLAATFFGRSISGWTGALGFLLLGALVGLGIGALVGAAKSGRLAHGFAALGLVTVFLAGIIFLGGGFDTLDEAYRRSGITAPEASTEP